MWEYVLEASTFTSCLLFRFKCCFCGWNFFGSGLLEPTRLLLVTRDRAQVVASEARGQPSSVTTIRVSNYFIIFRPPQHAAANYLGAVCFWTTAPLTANPPCKKAGAGVESLGLSAMTDKRRIPQLQVAFGIIMGYVGTIWG